MKAVRAISALMLSVCATGMLFGPALAQKRPASKVSKPKARSTIKRQKMSQPAWPSFDVRQGDFMRLLSAANAAGEEAPDPLTQYLVDELIVTGLFETEEGYGAFLHAVPSGNTFFASPGAVLYNGRLEEIQIGRPGYLEDVRLVFTERTSSRGSRERTVVKEVVGIERKAAPAPAPPEQPPAAASGDGAAEGPAT